MTKPQNHAFRLKMAQQKAEALLREEGIATLWVDPSAIAASRDIEVKAKQDTPTAFPECCSGMAMYSGFSMRRTSQTKAFTGSASLMN